VISNEGVLSDFSVIEEITFNVDTIRVDTFIFAGTEPRGGIVKEGVNTVP
jgi:hypothetical protein